MSETAANLGIVKTHKKMRPYDLYRLLTSEVATCSQCSTDDAQRTYFEVTCGRCMMYGLPTLA